MTKHKSSSGPGRITISDHMRSLPLRQKMSRAQQMLIKLTPHWQQWLAKQLPSSCRESAVLSHFENGQLDIACSNASIASGIKHLQQSLITFLNHQGFDEVKRLNIRIELLSGPDTDANSTAAHPAAAEHFTKPSERSIEAIRQCQKQSKNKPLSEALQRLRETLKNR